MIIVASAVRLAESLLLYGLRFSFHCSGRRRYHSVRDQININSTHESVVVVVFGRCRCRCARRGNGSQMARRARLCVLMSLVGHDSDQAGDSPASGSGKKLAGSYRICARLGLGRIQIWRRICRPPNFSVVSAAPPIRQAAETMPLSGRPISGGQSKSEPEIQSLDFGWPLSRMEAGLCRSRLEVSDSGC